MVWHIAHQPMRPAEFARGPTTFHGSRVKPDHETGATRHLRAASKRHTNQRTSIAIITRSKTDCATATPERSPRSVDGSTFLEPATPCQKPIVADVSCSMFTTVNAGWPVTHHQNTRTMTGLVDGLPVHRPSPTAVAIAMNVGGSRSPATSPDRNPGVPRLQLHRHATRASGPAESSIPRVGRSKPAPMRT